MSSRRASPVFLFRTESTVSLHTTVRLSVLMRTKPSRHKRLCLHRHEAQHEQIDTGGDHRQAEQDEDQTQGHVSGLVGERLVVLQGNVFTYNLTALLAIDSGLEAELKRD